MRTPRQWWRDRTRAHRRRQAALANQNEPLREFVYLDEVSVYSLLASRIGALATEFSASESSSLSTEVKSQLGASSPVVRAQVGSSVKANQTAGSQVMRKATVQSTFREFYGYVRDGLKLAAETSPSMPRIDRVEDLLTEANKEHCWVVNATSLQRGDVLEIEVALDADDAFRASTILTTIFSILRELNQVPASADRRSMGDAITAMRVLEGLLAGVVPIRGKAINYRRLVVDDFELIVRREICDQLGVESDPISVVGICEAELFWRDLRRVVFASSEYRVLCRLGRSGLVSNWSPVKLTDLLEGVVPELRDIIEEMPSALAQVRNDKDAETPTVQMRAALEAYAAAIVAHGGGHLSPGDLHRHALPTPEQCAAHENFSDRRAAFAELTDVLTGEFDVQVTPLEAARYRAEALQAAGLLEFQNPDVPGAPGSNPTGSNQFLDCEVIAIYW